MKMEGMGGLPVVTVEDPGLSAAAREVGCFYLRHPLFDEARCRKAVGLARWFFALPEEEKRALAIERSPHFRGYSVMRNERDWREQIHFGREEGAVAGDRECDRLRGPNLWPADLGWKRDVVGLMADLERVGREVLACLGEYMGVDERAYLLLKMIHYHASPAGVARPGVAAHVDFSWITLLVQDDAGGLEICTPAGEWVAVPPVPGTVVVNLGEVLQFASGGYYQATPHRVTTGEKTRVSLPFFLNPSLDMVVAPRGGEAHVHRVLADGPMDFGEAEWRRKGLGVWCAGCC